MPKFGALAHGQIKFNHFNVKYTFSLKHNELIFERASNKINTKARQRYTFLSMPTLHRCATSDDLSLKIMDSTNLSSLNLFLEAHHHYIHLSIFLLSTNLCLPLVIYLKLQTQNTHKIKLKDDENAH
jgi:hypothetical protein